MVSVDLVCVGDGVGGVPQRPGCGGPHVPWDWTQRWGCKPDVGVRAAGVLSKVFCLKGIPELHTREEVMKNGD